MRDERRDITPAVISVLLFCVAALALAFFATALFSSFAPYLLALGAGAICHRLYPLLPPGFRKAWTLPILVSLSAALGIAIAAFSLNSWLAGLWAAPVLAGALAALTEFLGSHFNRRCALCNRRMGSEPALVCPRCGLAVCDRSCWSFEHIRCSLCLQNQVPIFPAEDHWWRRQFGGRFERGQCSLCMAAAADADLRLCPRCGRPQCRDCWELSNGVCSRCEWMVSELPARLAVLLGAPAAPPAPTRIRANEGK